MRFKVHDEMEERMKKTIDVLKSELASVRTGKANPKVMESIYVDYYGTQTPINQLASISAPEARTLIVKPYDASSLENVEKAILKSDLGINPNNDGEKIILNFPMLTEERRTEFSKVVKEYAEEARVALRNERRDANQELEKMEDKSEITEDDLRRGKDTVQELTDKYNDKIDQMLEKKINEIMAI
jgi:ribosome recycling factor